MSPRFRFDGSIYTVRESPDFSVIVNRLVAKRFGVAAARDRQEIRETEFPLRSWSGIVGGATYTIEEIETPASVLLLAATAAVVKEQADALKAAQDARDDAVRAAFDDGLTASTIASTSGLSVARAYQIRERRR